MAICALTANLGNFDKQIDPVKQSVPFDFHRITDKEFPPRHCAMTPRMQARIVKCFGWQLVPNYDIYVWVDSSMSITHPDAIRWLVEQCKDDIALFRHPHRKTVLEEAEYLKKRLAKGCPYITPRYENELIDEQVAAVKGFFDDMLFASTVMVYKNNDRVKDMMYMWWHHISRYHIIDQLSLPFCLGMSRCKYDVIEDNYLKCKYLSYTRVHGHNSNILHLKSDQ